LSPRPGLAYLLVGATGLAALILLFPLTGTPEPQRIARVAAYALVLVCVVSVLHGFLLAARGYATPRVLALGADAAGFLSAAASHFLNLRYPAVRLLRHAPRHDRGFAARTSATRPPVRCRRIRARKRGPHPRFSHEEAPIQRVDRCAGSAYPLRERDTKSRPGLVPGTSSLSEKRPRLRAWIR
jgi:hypothetical protein